MNLGKGIARMVHVYHGLIGCYIGVIDSVC